MAEPKPATQKKTWLASNDGVIKEVGTHRRGLALAPRHAASQD